MLISFIVPWLHEYPICAHSILAQTDDNWEIIHLHDGPLSDKEKIYNDSIPKDDRIKSIILQDGPHNDWGHFARNEGIKYLGKESTAVVFTNGDSYYLPSFVSDMSRPFHSIKTMATYCNFLQHYNDNAVLDSKLIYGHIDCGNFMIRTGIAKAMGWKYRYEQADWGFINDVILQHGKERMIKINKNLYVHN